jgi:hypothetical protein
MNQDVDILKSKADEARERGLKFVNLVQKIRTSNYVKHIIAYHKDTSELIEEGGLTMKTYPLPKDLLRSFTIDFRKLFLKSEANMATGISSLRELMLASSKEISSDINYLLEFYKAGTGHGKFIAYQGGLCTVMIEGEDYSLGRILKAFFYGGLLHEDDELAKKDWEKLSSSKSEARFTFEMTVSPFIWKVIREACWVADCLKNDFNIVPELGSDNGLI